MDEWLLISELPSVRAMERKRQKKTDDTRGWKWGLNKEQLKMMLCFPDGCWDLRSEIKKSRRKNHFGEKAELSEGLYHSWIANDFSPMTKLFSVARSLHKRFIST